MLRFAIYKSKLSYTQAYIHIYTYVVTLVYRDFILKIGLSVHARTAKRAVFRHAPDVYAER